MRAHRLVVGVAALGLIVAGGLVLRPSGGGQGGGAAASGFPRDRDQWALPLDRYQGMPYEVSDYAERLLVQDCTDARGVAYGLEPPTFSVSLSDGAIFNSRMRRLFDGDIAARYGYVGPPRAPEHDAALAANDALLDDPAAVETVRSCIDEARETLPLPPPRDLPDTLASEAYDAAMTSGAVEEATAEWQRCMAAEDRTQLPARPVDMPTPVMVAEWGAARPTEDEVAVALDDAACRESSGYSAVLYDEEWRAQRDMVDQHEADLVRLEAANEEHARLVRAVLDDHDVAVPPAAASGDARDD